ncbi:hypothetical protein ACFRAI_22330 [Streptomyces sp. NPDC056637]|uniref:hypothetical protein n=1 Tax=unclassified Streptomyces TaxID=2593676 RepID=UPI00368275AA
MDCNISLGKVKDNPDTLSRMVNYLGGQRFMPVTSGAGSMSATTGPETRQPG